MAVVFQLARIRYASPSSPSSACTFEIPEATKTILENLIDPLVVVSYLGYSQAVQEALWSTLHQSSRLNKGKSVDFKFAEATIASSNPKSGSSNSASNNATVNNFTGGIWARTGSTSATGAGVAIDKGDSPSAQILYLFYRADSPAPEETHDHDHDTMNRSLDAILTPLLALCSTQLNIISETTHDTAADMDRFCRSLTIFSPNRPVTSDLRAQDIAKLGWRWCRSSHKALFRHSSSSTPTDFDYKSTDTALATLEKILTDSTTTEEDESTHTESFGGYTEAKKGHIATLRRYFRTVECYAPSSTSRLSVIAAGKRPKRDAENPLALGGVERFNTERSLERTLQDLTRSRRRTFSGSPYSPNEGSGVDSAWIKDLLSVKRMADIIGIHSGDTRVVNGAVLYSRIQTCLLQLNRYPSSFSVKEMRLSLYDLIRDRGLYYGIHAYHRIMNEHLDRQPIPLPWHILSMIHQDALSKSLEEIERRFYGPECRLPQLLREFRAHCLETGNTGNISGPGAVPGSVSTRSAADSPTGVSVGSMSDLDAMVPTGGLYLEYYNANASALQNHHLVTLDEYWQVLLKSRLLGAQNASASAVPSSGLVGQTSRTSLDIKDYSEFVQAVDQVRRSYLETCIPSPEAITVLENLDDMQQSEAALFLQTLAATAASLNDSVSSPITLTSGSLRRYSVSSSLAVSSPRSSIVAAKGLQVLTESADGADASSQSADNTVEEEVQVTLQQISQVHTTELEQQIAEILQNKRSADDRNAMVNKSDLAQESDSSSSSEIAITESAVAVSAGGGKKSVHASTSTATGGDSNGSNADANDSTVSQLKDTDNTKSVVQFGWTLHMLHANTLQYAWIWTWLYVHEGSSRQNVGKLACDSKMYTASKWIILPAKDLIRSRKDWKVSYGDRVWLVSYWFSTRNAKMDLPEYLPRARGAACRHVIPYGETYVICKTCPADILCMRCFRASDHTDHTMYLQCSWGTSVCVCGDPSRLKSSHALHCSLHCAESQRSYSGLAKGKPCQIKFKAGDKVYQCKQNHFGHDVVAQIAEAGSTCSCHDNKSWNPDLRCTYHTPGPLEIEYMPRAVSTSVSSPSMPSQSHHHRSEGQRASLEMAVSKTSSVPPISTDASSNQTLAPSSPSKRCGHIFQPGEDIYHCRDCSFNDRVVLCSRCFHSSACVGHRWRMGEFQAPRTPEILPETVETEHPQPGEMELRKDSSPSSFIVDALDIGDELDKDTDADADTDTETETETETARNSNQYPRDNAHSNSNSGDGSDSPEVGEEAESDVVMGVSCDCGDPRMFRTAFDCNYHLPEEFRPVPSLVHCNYLFLLGDVMYRCRTCHVVDNHPTCLTEVDSENKLQEKNIDKDIDKDVDIDINNGHDNDIDDNGSDIMHDKEEQTDDEEHECEDESDLWICGQCFDLGQHQGHDIETATNRRNEGLYCHCGDQTILREPSSSTATPATTETSVTECKDDHNRQNILCTTDIKSGMYYYKCQSCQTDPNRIFCEPCFVSEAHKYHAYERLCAPTGFETIRCGCGENSAFRFATHCQQHERAGGTNIVHKCRYRAQAGEWISQCRDCYPRKRGMPVPYLCLRCRQTSEHTGHDIQWVLAEEDMSYPCACGSCTTDPRSFLSPSTSTSSSPVLQATVDDTDPESVTVDDIDSTSVIDDDIDQESVGADDIDQESVTTDDIDQASIISPSGSLPPEATTDPTATIPSISISEDGLFRNDAKLPPPLCQYHVMIYKTTPSTTLYLHSHNYRAINHQDHNEVTGYRYHDNNNDWIVTRPDDETGDPDTLEDGGGAVNSLNTTMSETNGKYSAVVGTKATPKSPYLQWKDVFWLKHANTGKYFNSMASLKISQGFQEVSALGTAHSNNDWIIEETTWLRQQILSDE
ncbi:hypothetical protein BG011_003973 [Mortierella polycephala]|uniref:E3 ubiquitin-protein ligase n=1 Tax=Mortierella polycephala TaxID=41804 RepID=A0A9P6QF31_9FUNG|nr:hypothetical protein BG011_003973 [Mortierella polycephala]